MKDIIKQIAGYAAVAIVAFITGLFVALNTAGQSSYLKINYGVNENGTPKEISILKPDITDYDYKNIPDYKASALCTKFKKLEYDDILSEHLRDLRDSYAGPFQKKVIEVYVRFTDDKCVKYPNAGGYMGDLMNQELSIFYLIEPEELRENFTHKSFQVMIESPIPDVPDPEVLQKTIWIEKKYAYEWLNIMDGEHLPERLIVKASIIRKVGTLPSEGILTSYLSEGALN